LKTILATAALLASCVSAARAQGASVHPSPAAGELIRVTPGSGAPFTGRLTALGGDTLLVAAPGGGADLMAVASRERVEVRRSHREAWSARGALAGIGVGLVAAMFQARGSKASGNTRRAEVAAVGGAAGGVLGGFMGFTLAPHQWQTLRVSGPRLARRPHVPPPPPAVAPLSAATVAPPPPADTSAAPVSVPVPPVDSAATPARPDSAGASIAVPRPQPASTDPPSAPPPSAPPTTPPPSAPSAPPPPGARD